MFPGDAAAAGWGSTLKSIAFQHGTPSSGASALLLKGIPRGLSIYISALLLLLLLSHFSHVRLCVTP